MAGSKASGNGASSTDCLLLVELPLLSLLLFLLLLLLWFLALAWSGEAPPFDGLILDFSALETFFIVVVIFVVV